METLRAVTHARCLAKPGVDRFTWGPSDVRFDLEAHPMHPFRTVDGCLCHVRKPLEGTAVPLNFRSNSLDLRNTSLDMGVTVLLERPKAWSGPPDTCGHYTAKPLEGETTMGERPH